MVNFTFFEIYLTCSKYTPLNLQLCVSLLTKIERVFSSDFPVTPNGSLPQVGESRGGGAFFGIFVNQNLKLLLNLPQTLASSNFLQDIEKFFADIGKLGPKIY